MVSPKRAYRSFFSTFCWLIIASASACMSLIRCFVACREKSVRKSWGDDQLTSMETKFHYIDYMIALIFALVVQMTSLQFPVYTYLGFIFAVLGGILLWTLNEWFANEQHTFVVRHHHQLRGSILELLHIHSVRLDVCLDLQQLVVQSPKFVNIFLVAQANLQAEKQSQQVVTQHFIPHTSISSSVLDMVTLLRVDRPGRVTGWSTVEVNRSIGQHLVTTGNDDGRRRVNEPRPKKAQSRCTSHPTVTPPGGGPLPTVRETHPQKLQSWCTL